jgi:hypothetical protein
MAKDPLKIVGQPNATPEERLQAESLSRETGRPAKMCRAALLQAGHDVNKAKALLDDPEFVRMNTDFDLGAIARLADNPMKAVEYTMLQQAAHAGKSEADLGKDLKRVRKVGDKYEAQRPKVEEYERRVKEAKGREITDPAFGRLTWDSLWEGTVNVPEFGKVRVTVEADAKKWDVATPPGDAPATPSLRSWLPSRSCVRRSRRRTSTTSGASATTTRRAGSASPKSASPPTSGPSSARRDCTSRSKRARPGARK